MKKLIAFILSVLMLVGMSVPVFATQNEEEVKTVEEILNGYHAKAFERQINQGIETAGTNSRSGGSAEKSLEGETVEELTAAGYEAYHVTSSNYDELEVSLKTDFADLGLDPNDSYIIVISGEEDNGQPNPNARVGSLPEQDHIDDGGSSFLYNYYGTYYKMRYFTVTGAEYQLSAHVDMLETFGETFVHNLINDGYSAYLDCMSGPLHLGTTTSLFGLNATGSYVVRNSSLVVVGTVQWTRRFIEIWDEQAEAWKRTSYSEYAHTTTDCVGHFYDELTESTGRYVWTDYQTLYSPYYYDTAQLKNNAVLSYNSASPINDRTGSISLYFKDRFDNVRYALTIWESI